MIISIHQPGYIPWLGFFKKIQSCDTFVFLDDAKYVKRQWHNRNQIRTQQGAYFLSVPIQSNSNEKINQVKISYNENWNIVHKKTLQFSYLKAKYFSDYWNFFEELYSKKFEYLIDLNMEIIKFLMKKFQINTKTIFASELGVQKKKSDLNLEICKILGADVYLSGIMGKDYLDEASFLKNNIKIEYQNFQHPIYKQAYEPFIPNMAAIDLLFNQGDSSAKVLLDAKNF